MAACHGSSGLPRAIARASGLGCAVALALLLPRGASPRDEGADGKFSERRSSHFVLLQDVDIDQRTGSSGSRRFERDVLEILESAHRLLDQQLGIRPRGAIGVVVYDPGAFDARFARLFGFAAAGFYNGAIHVRGGSQIDARLVQTLHHEYLHAALHDVAPEIMFPGLLNEGIAEWFEGLSQGKRHLSAGERAVLVDAARRGSWLPFSSLLGPSFAGLDPDQALLAYLESYGVVEHLVRHHGERGLRELCEQLIRTANLERALRRSVGGDLASLEAALRNELH